MSVDRPNWTQDNEPKSTGVKILIPNPQELHQFVLDQSARSGDKTRGELLKAHADWLTGGSKPNTLTWESSMDNLLLARYEVQLDAGYSPKSGEWADFVSFLWTSSIDTSWEAAQKAEEIRDILKGKGLNATLEVDPAEEYGIHITSNDSPQFVTFHLGHKRVEDAVAIYGEEPANQDGNNPLIIRPGRDHGTLSLDLAEFTKQLDAYRNIAPHAISALYETFDYKTPNVELELTI